LAPALPVLGQGSDAFEAIDPENPYMNTRVIPGFGYRSKADIDSGGEFDELAFSVRGGPSFALGNDIRLNAIASYRYSHYDFSGFGIDPWENIHTFRLTPLFVYKMDDAWSFWGGPTVAFSAEEGADWSKAFTGGAFAGVNYHYSDVLSFGGGLGITSQIEDHPAILPILLANWKFADQWTARVGFSEVAASGGIGAEVSYDLNEQWKLGAGIQFQRKRFRLDESGPIPDGVGQDKSVPIYVKAAWELSPSATLEFLVGINAGGQVLAEDNDGQRLAKEDYDPSALIGFRAVFSF